MADVYLYADETGNLDFDGASKAGGSAYFGFGTAVFPDDHGHALWAGLRLRARMESRDVRLPRGFHAVNDSSHTRAEMFAEVKAQSPRIDATLLLKANAYENVRAAGEMRLYKMAWYLHFKHVAEHISEPGDTLYVVVSTLTTKARQTQARTALHDVCSQIKRDSVLCVWDAGTSWGLQVADYALWAIQRRTDDRPGTWWEDYVRESTSSVYFPWRASRNLDW
jgi:Protein of unknown function (DUF3800)